MADGSNGTAGVGAAAGAPLLFNATADLTNGTAGIQGDAQEAFQEVLAPLPSNVLTSEADGGGGTAGDVRVRRAHTHVGARHKLAQPISPAHAELSPCPLRLPAGWQTALLTCACIAGVILATATGALRAAARHAPAALLPALEKCSVLLVVSGFLESSNHPHDACESFP